MNSASFYRDDSESDINPPKLFLTLDQVTIRLRDRFVFEDTSWQIKSDEQWAVIGPNGAGKSTLVKALAGDLPMVRGRAVYHFLEEMGVSDSAPDGQVARVAFGHGGTSTAPRQA
jgi:ABC-type molybdenum transport system ATPase subunit/photorepair protein PhrA